MHFALSQMFPKAPPCSTDERHHQCAYQSAEGGPCLTGKTVVSSHSLGMLMEQAPSCLLSSVSVAEITLENYKTCEQLQAIVLAFILIVNFYDKMILVPVHQRFCSQGSHIRILPSGSFSLGELIMTLALSRKGTKKAALGQQCSLCCKSGMHGHKC